MKAILIVGAGGLIGSIGRYAMQLLATRFFASAFPLGTFAVNLLGSLIIGVVYGLSSRGTITDDWKLFLATGICGGFTTFSAFALENVSLLRQGDYVMFVSYTVVSVVVGLGAVVLGMYVAR